MGEYISYCCHADDQLFAPMTNQCGCERYIMGTRTTWTMPPPMTVQGKRSIQRYSGRLQIEKIIKRQ